MKMKKITQFENTLRLHFALLILMLLNLVVYNVFGFRINNNLSIGLKFIVYFTGIVLFIAYLRPFRAIVIYFSFFFLSPVVLITFYFVHGIFFALLSTAVLAPIFPLNSEYSGDNIKIYSKFNGFLGRCCDYYITQGKVYLFEKNIGEIVTEGEIDFETSSIVLKSDSIIIEPSKAIGPKKWYASDSVYRIKLIR